MVNVAAPWTQDCDQDQFYFTLLSLKTIEVNINKPWHEIVSFEWFEEASVCEKVQTLLSLPTGRALQR